MKLSNQGMGAIMMVLQKCLMEERDIVPLLQEMNFQVDGPSQSELIVTNPPVVSFDDVEISDDATSTTENSELSKDDVSSEEE
jgi:hypothetical protein|tara:strand:+ start:753 stop:1001 length:249 start_codon:yes stop_codon:yes gene_type:complete